MMTVSRKEFIEKVGREPTDDDLERCNCFKAGDVGHFLCGWCDVHNLPRFECGCVKDNKKDVTGS